ncbi:glycosyltransferase family 2 protein [bacterium]|nr:glycosyltransferase family 2 protein [bacterium]
MEHIKIAVLITCHNRKEKTLLCLDALNAQVSEGKFDLRVYVVDSGSTDGTAEAILKRYPEVNLISCSEDIYWCGGMHLAWAEAMKEDYDYYLWLNDDTMLFPDAIETLLSTVYTLNKSIDNSAVIIVGSTYHPETGVHTYGGCIQAKKKSLDFKSVIPSASIQACDTFNGNCVLISRETFQKLGNISTEFTHAMGDIDYGLRAKEKNIPMWVAPKYAGKCGHNPLPSWLDNNLSLHKRIINLNNPKGLPPKEWMIFCRRHTGWRWPFNVAKLYVRVLSPNAWDRIKKVIK